MATINLNCSNLSSGYPGGHKPNPIIFECVVDKHPSKYEIRNKYDRSILESRKHYKVELVAPAFQRENLFVSAGEDCCLFVMGVHTKDEITEKKIPAAYGEIWGFYGWNQTSGEHRYWFYYGRI